jgi:hypothetical protein
MSKESNMKKFTSLLISCSLALTGAALAQQPEEQSSPKPNSAEKHKGHAAEGKSGASEAKPAAVIPEKPAVKKLAPKTEKIEGMKAPETSTAEKPQATSAKHHAAAKAEKTQATPKPTAATTKAPDVSTQPAATAPPAAKKHAKGKNEPKAADAAKASPAGTAAAPANEAVSQPKPQAAAAKKPDPQKVKEIKAEHADFHAQPKPEQVPAVTFNESRRIEGSDQWQGQQYEVFRSYHPERHDEHWYRSHYDRVELVGGGYYYEHKGYWYPAWGYKPSSEYYVYDGPIYAGHRAEPPDRVIADVQAVLQHMGYYKGEVDGLLGPLTREALTGYQNDQGLARTAAIDEPTLDALGME